jgi:hypothetical protein
MPVVAELVERWRGRAGELAPYAPAAAEAFKRAAAELEAVIRSADDQPLTLSDAASESGYSAERLRHMLADGELPNAGRKGAPRIRRADLPRKRRKDAGRFDAAAAATRILRADK